MIKRIITLKPKLGKIQEARQFAKELSDLVNKKHPGIMSEVYAEKYGEAGTICFLAQFENVGNLEETMSVSRDDTEIGNMMARGIELFVDDSVKVTLLESF